MNRVQLNLQTPEEPPTQSRKQKVETPRGRRDGTSKPGSWMLFVCAANTTGKSQESKIGALITEQRRIRGMFARLNEQMRSLRNVV